MLLSPNYGFHRNPRFSVNQLAEYLFTTNAGQREAVIRSAKFPRKASVIPYSQAKRTICDFMASNTGNLSYFDDPIRRLETRLRREPDGWMQDELRRNLDAIAAFKKAFTKCRAKRYAFVTGPTDTAMMLEGVRVNSRLDVTVTETDREGVTSSGGCVMFIASTDNSRKNIEDRRKVVAATIHWTLESAGGNIEPLARLCMSFDVFGSVITKAPTAIDRLRQNIRSSCQEAAGRWDDVAPPAGYDGPNWR